MVGMLPDEIHTAVCNRIAALTPLDGYTTATASGYSHSANDAWRLSDQPLVPEFAPSTQAHLIFFLDDRAFENFGSMTETDALLLNSLCTVRFLFEMRPYDQVRDWRAAGVAGMHLLSWLSVDGWSEQLNIYPADGQVLLRTPVGNGEWLACELRIRLHFACTQFFL